MEFKLAQLDWKNILKDSVSGIYYTRRDWKKLMVTDESVMNDWADGRIVSRTYARYRVITLEWYIDRMSDTPEEEVVSYLEQLFSLTEWGNSGERELYIQDIYDNERTLNVKVKESFYCDYADTSFTEAVRKWRVVLESTSDPVFKSYQEIIESGLEWQYGWVELDCELWTELDDYYNMIECETIGNQPAPAKFVITATGNINKPLTIRNLTAWNEFVLDIDAVAGDVIIIDSNTYTVTKNGVNAIADRLEWSVFPFISGTTLFTIFDIDGDLYEKDLTIDIYFRDNLL